MAGQPEHQIETSKSLDYARILMLRLEFASDADTYQRTYNRLMDVLSLDAHRNGHLIHEVGGRT